MNHMVSKTLEFMSTFRDNVADIDSVDIVLCPPFTSLCALVDAIKGTSIKIGAQNVHWGKNGAFTGEISISMLLEIPVDYVIIGHSERRQYFGESDATVNSRLSAALTSQITPIVCIGEKLEERESGITETVLSEQINGGFQGISADQMKHIVLAYEPVWAIGTGVTATPEQAQEAHAFIRRVINKKYGTKISESIRIQYGGSVKSSNAESLLSQPDIDGALVGGASLDPNEFSKIIRSV